MDEGWVRLMQPRAAGIKRGLISNILNSASCPAEVPGIHEFLGERDKRAWMAGTSPAMTAES
jgi:hypothetical protein